MLKSISVGIGVALALPLGWLFCWRLGIISLDPPGEGKAYGLYGFVGGEMAELSILGSVLGLITGLLLYIFHFRRA